MPLLDRQQRGVVLGAIRIGHKVTAGNGKVRPEKLSTFRLTSPDQQKIGWAAELYGGEPRPWTPDGSRQQQWEVVTERDRLDVRVPPGSPVQQDYELWGGTRQRLCDGRTERLKTGGGPCLCPPDLLVRKRLAADGSACKPVTRLSLILADLPGLGVWMLSSTGDAAADELASTARLLHEAAGAGVMLAAVLRLEQRRSGGSGEVHHFAVPVLDVQTSLVALEAGQRPATPAALAAPRRQALAAAEDVPPPPPRETHGPAAGPVGAPRNPQACAELAGELANEAEVVNLAGYARERGWLDQMVEVDGVVEDLGGLLMARRLVLARAGRPG